MFGILAKFFRFSGRENGNKFKLSMVIGLIEALASAMKIPAIMYILIGLLSGKPTGKYIGGSVAIMVIAIVVDVICKRYGEGGRMICLGFWQNSFVFQAGKMAINLNCR